MIQKPPSTIAGYNHKQIGWELERTAMGDGFYGNALRVAKDMPGMKPVDRAILDAFATGDNKPMGHIYRDLLQEIARRVYFGEHSIEHLKKAVENIEEEIARLTRQLETARVKLQAAQEEEKKHV